MTKSFFITLILLSSFSLCGQSLLNVEDSLVSEYEQFHKESLQEHLPELLSIIENNIPENKGLNSEAFRHLDNNDLITFSQKKVKNFDVKGIFTEPDGTIPDEKISIEKTYHFKEDKKTTSKELLFSFNDTGLEISAKKQKSKFSYILIPYDDLLFKSLSSEGIIFTKKSYSSKENYKGKSIKLNLNLGPLSIDERESVYRLFKSKLAVKEKKLLLEDLNKIKKYDKNDDTDYDNIVTDLRRLYYEHLPNNFEPFSRLILSSSYVFNSKIQKEIFEDSLKISKELRKDLILIDNYAAVISAVKLYNSGDHNSSTVLNKIVQSIDFSTVKENSVMKFILEEFIDAGNKDKLSSNIIGAKDSIELNFYKDISFITGNKENFFSVIKENIGKIGENNKIRDYIVAEAKRGNESFLNFILANNKMTDALLESDKEYFANIKLLKIRTHYILRGQYFDLLNGVWGGQNTTGFVKTNERVILCKKKTEILANIPYRFSISASDLIIDYLIYEQEYAKKLLELRKNVTNISYETLIAATTTPDWIYTDNMNENELPEALRNNQSVIEKRETVIAGFGNVVTNAFAVKELNELYNKKQFEFRQALIDTFGKSIGNLYLEEYSRHCGTTYAEDKYNYWFKLEYLETKDSYKTDTKMNRLRLEQRIIDIFRVYIDSNDISEVEKGNILVQSINGGRYYALWFLLDRGLSPNLRNEYGKTVYDQLKEEGTGPVQSQMYKLIKQYE